MSDFLKRGSHQRPGKQITYNDVNKFLLKLRNIIEQCDLKNKNIEKDIKNLHNKISSIEGQLVAEKEENSRLNAKMEGSKRKAKLISDQNATNTDTTNRIKNLEDRIEQLQQQNNEVLKKVVKAMIETDGDISAFCLKILGKTVCQYPKSDKITLHREDPKICIYDFMGATPFDDETQELEFKVLEKGWRDNDTIWIEAKISPLK